MSPIFVSLMLLDLLHPIAAAVVSVPDTQYAERGSGTLSVVVDPIDPIGSIPRGATRVPFLTVNLSASCESDIRITSLEIKHVGLGSTGDIASVYAIEAYARVTRSARFDVKSGIATLRFRSFVIPKCAAATILIAGDMTRDATVASEHGMMLSGVFGIVSNAKRTMLTIGDATKNVITTPSDPGSLTVRLLPVSSHVRFGRIETVARLQLTTDAKSAYLLKSITLTNAENARDMDLQWLSLEMLSGSVLTAPLPRMHGYSATLALQPTLVLHAGSTLVLNLKAEIHASQSKKINFVVEEPSDVVATPYRER